MRFLLVILTLTLVGCASYSFSHVHLNGNGTYLYNGIPVTGNTTLDAWSCIGTCPPVNGEVVNGCTVNITR